MTDTPTEEFHKTYNISDLSRYFNRSDDSRHPNNYAVFYEIEMGSDMAVEDMVRVLGMTMALCLEGEAELGIGVKKYTLRKNSLIRLSPNEYVRLISTSKSVRIMAIGFNLEIMESIVPKLAGFLPILIHNPIEAVTQLSDSAFEHVREYMLMIGRKIDAPHSTWKRLKVTSLIQSLICEVMEQHYTTIDGQEKPHTRKEELISRFILEVLQNFRNERSVAYYADKLCVSPKHLSSVSKEITQHTAGTLIDLYVIMEAKTMLAETSLTVQEISNRLNFANQSFFGKYFKHLTGYSPSDFRKMSFSR